jgi:hypothetical protein
MTFNRREPIIIMDMWTITKYSGILLFILIVILIITGFSYSGLLGLDAVIDPASALVLHSNPITAGILIILIIVHCCLRALTGLRNRSGKGESKPEAVQPAPLQPQPQPQPEPQPEQPKEEPQPQPG